MTPGHGRKGTRLRGIIPAGTEGIVARAGEKAAMRFQNCPRGGHPILVDK